MKELRLGLKPGVGPVLKIMKNDADNPFTTPNNQFGKFLFNSENQKVGYVREILIFEPDFVNFPSAGGLPAVPNYYPYPLGSTWANCRGIVASGRTTGSNEFQSIGLKQSWFTERYGINYLPLCEIRPFSANGVYAGPYVNVTQGQVSGNGFVQSGIVPDFFSRISVHEYWNGSNFVWQDFAVSIHIFSGPVGGPWNKFILTVYDLPMLSGAIPDNSGSVTSGQEPIRIDPAGGSIARIALPGRTVSDPNPNNYILHENRIPAKVIAAGEVTLPGNGTATISCNFPLDASTYSYMDYHARRTQDSEYYVPPFFSSADAGWSMNFTYRVNPSNNRQVILTNSESTTFVIRYAIYANSAAAPTTGGKNILWSGNDGSQDFIQIKRPGSHDTNWNLNDIMIDTRLSYLPLLADGYIAKDNFANKPSTNYKGNRWQTITVNNPNDLKLMVKCGIIFPGQTSPNDDNGHLQYYVNPVAHWGDHRVGAGTGSQAGLSDGSSSWAVIYPSDNTRVDLWMRSDNVRLVVGGSSSWGSAPAGLRYYIFGIPTSL